MDRLFHRPEYVGYRSQAVVSSSNFMGCCPIQYSFNLVWFTTSKRISLGLGTWLDSSFVPVSLHFTLFGYWDDGARSDFGGKKTEREKGKFSESCLFWLLNAEQFSRRVEQIYLFKYSSQTVNINKAPRYPSCQHFWIKSKSTAQSDIWYLQRNFGLHWKQHVKRNK